MRDGTIVHFASGQLHRVQTPVNIVSNNRICYDQQQSMNLLLAFVDEIHSRFPHLIPADTCSYMSFCWL